MRLWFCDKHAALLSLGLLICTGYPLHILDNFSWRSGAPVVFEVEQQMGQPLVHTRSLSQTTLPSSRAPAAPSKAQRRSHTGATSG